MTIQAATLLTHLAHDNGDVTGHRVIAAAYRNGSNMVFTLPLIDTGLSAP
jgi:hypothetical protein